MRSHYAEERRRGGLFTANQTEQIRAVIGDYILLRLRWHSRQWGRFHVQMEYHPRTGLEETACGRYFDGAMYTGRRLVHPDNLEDEEIREICQRCVTALAMRGLRRR